MTELRNSLPKKLFEIIAAVILVVFTAGVIQLFLLRFKAGDVYPYYSSLRTDPLGGKALYESLQQCCGFVVWRNYDPFHSIKDKHQAAILFLGETLPGTLLPKEFFNELNAFVSGGGRLVVTHLPQKAAKPKPVVSEKPKNEIDPLEEANFVKFTERWGYSYAVQEKSTNTPALLGSDIDEPGLPKTVSAHTALYFKNPDAKWRVLYRQEGLPVLMEKPIGKGTMVLSAITYFLSNEAMLRERHPGLILWLTGGKSEIIFDEYFHGMGKTEGVTALMRKYNLEITLLLLIILALLYIWRNALPLVPIPESERKTDITSSLGKDSSAGLTNLLRRNISMNKILSVCYSEWKKTAPIRQAVSSEKLSRIDTILTAEKKHPVAAYNQISEVLKEK